MPIKIELTYISQNCAIERISVYFFAEFSAQFIFIKMTLLCDFMFHITMSYTTKRKNKKKHFEPDHFFFSLFYVFNSQSQRFFEWHEKNSFIYNVWCNINSLVSFGKSFVSRLAYVTNAKFIQINHGSESRSCDRIQAMQATQGNNSQKLVE